MGCVQLCNFHFCCPAIYCQPMKKFEFFVACRATRQQHLKTSSTPVDENEPDQSMRRVFVSYPKAIRFVRFDGKSVNRGLPVLNQTRALDLCHRQKGSWALGTRMQRTPTTLLGRACARTFTLLPVVLHPVVVVAA